MYLKSLRRWFQIGVKCMDLRPVCYKLVWETVRLKLWKLATQKLRKLGQHNKHTKSSQKYSLLQPLKRYSWIQCIKWPRFPGSIPIKKVKKQDLTLFSFLQSREMTHWNIGYLSSWCVLYGHFHNTHHWSTYPRLAASTIWFGGKLEPGGLFFLPEGFFFYRSSR